ncbi:TonB-dependent receptor, partial [bacterium]|nr:TonB-dependent receptor [bacterium]
MKNITCCFLFSALTVAPLWAAGQSLSGRVVDANTKKPLPGVSVYLVKNGVSGMTGDDGKFLLKAANTGPDTLVCRSIDNFVEKIVVSIPGTIEVSLETNVHVLETVEVRAARPDELPLYARTSASVNVIDRENIPERSATVDEVLDSEVGIDTRSLGGIGGRTSVSIRGSTSEQIEVYIDGIPLSAGGSGLTGFAFVPMSQVDRIEIYRGTSPGTFG